MSEQRARDGARVHLSLPARPAYARVARIGAASLAHRWGFPPHQVQDLRLAVDEAIILLLAGHREEPGSINIEYALDDGVLQIDVHAGFDDAGAVPALEEDALDRFRTLAGELLTGYDLGAHRVGLTIERAG
ncbi:MAG: ATP-binding protein [Acidimicrobiia bacterium]|nr:ATP-binding protein [Acidimicrobiia bacterium]